MTEPTSQIPPAERVPQESAPRAVAVLLCNQQGELLLQRRDAAAPIGPHLWCTIGGAVEPGETPEQAAARELAEETGLRTERLSLWWEGDLPKNAGPALTRWWVYTGVTTATAADVVVGEGAELRFLPCEQALDRQLLPSARTLLNRWIRTSD